MNDEVILESENTPMGKFQKERTEAISEMFDNVSENGIYPTTKFFVRLDNCVRGLLINSAQEILDRFYPSSCPHCERPLNWRDYIKPEEIAGYIKGEK